MLYAVRYDREFSDRREEAAFQKLLARRLLGHALKREYRKDPAELTMETGPHGKPYFAGETFRFNLSHCRGLVCCVLGEEENGVDCEPIREYDPRLAERICTPEELSLLEQAEDPGLALTLLWTGKESLMKLSGKGLAYGFRNAVFSGTGECLSAPEVKTACFLTLPGYAVSVCSLGDCPGELNVIDLSHLMS